MGENHGSQAWCHYAQVHVRCCGVALTVFRAGYSCRNIAEERVEWDGAAGVLLFGCMFARAAVLVEGVVKLLAKLRGCRGVARWGSRCVCFFRIAMVL
jgi:hypothetical protein